MRIIRLYKKTAAAVLFFFVLQTGCAGPRGAPLPSLAEPGFRGALEAQAHIGAAPAALLAGIGKREITPPVGTPLLGYSRRKGRPSTGVHDPLFARALALKDGTDLLVLVSCDLLAVNDALYERILASVNLKFPLSRQQLILFASHNHSGTGGLGSRLLERMIGGRYNERVFEATAGLIAESVVEAVGDLRPAEAGLAQSRLDGFIENRMIENGPVDDELKVLRVDREGRPAAFLVNMAAHPTILNARNFLISADFPGYLEARVESANPGAVCLFSNGAAGDQRIHGFTESEGFEKARVVGEAIAEKVLETASGARMESRAEIITLQSKLTLPPVKIKRGHLSLPSWLGNRLIGREIMLNAATVNDIVFLTVPGEMTGEIGSAIKEKAGERNFRPVILGYANGYMGYIVPERLYGNKTYESGVSFFGPGLERYFRETAEAQMEFLKEKMS